MSAHAMAAVPPPGVDDAIEIFHRQLAVEALTAVENAAIVASEHIGCGDANAADQAAAWAVKSFLNHTRLDPVIKGGETHTPETRPQVGAGLANQVNLWLDAIDGVNLVVNGMPGAVSVIGIGIPNGSGSSHYHAPADTHYAYKLVCGPLVKERMPSPDYIGLHLGPAENVKRVAELLDKPVEQMVVTLLGRERNEPSIGELRQLKARLRLITDGDIDGGISCCLPRSQVRTATDMLIGIGGSSEARISAMGVKCLGGFMQTRNWASSKDSRGLIKLLQESGEMDRIRTIDQLVPDDRIIFAMSGITPSASVDGVTWRHDEGFVVTHSLVTRNTTGTLRFPPGYHKLGQKVIDTNAGQRVIR